MRIKLLQLLDWNSKNWKFEILRIQSIKNTSISPYFTCEKYSKVDLEIYKYVYLHIELDLIASTHLERRRFNFLKRVTSHGNCRKETGCRRLVPTSATQVAWKWDFVG